MARTSHQTIHGIIPAYAGSTMSPFGAGIGSGDHPRIRGEHRRPEIPAGCSAGSSPHTRGAPPSRPMPSSSRGIIPAYAGSTEECVPRHPLRPDHPRIRGEHRRSSSPTPSTAGSSPHTRGAPPQGGEGGFPDGIIPAYAGSTSSHPTCELPRTDHPRIRGEHE